MKKIYLFYVLLLLLSACSKQSEVVEQPMKIFTFTGTVVDDETSQPITDARMYLLHGKMSCCSYPDAGAKLDSTKTDDKGRYSIAIKRLKDTALTYAYNFDNVKHHSYNPYFTIESTEKFFPSRFDFANRIKADTLIDDYKLNVDYRVLKAAKLYLSFKDITPPFGDSVFINVKNNYPKYEFTKNIPEYNVGTPNRAYFDEQVYLIVNKQTIITTTTKLNGISKIRRDTFSNVQAGLTKSLIIEF